MAANLVFDVFNERVEDNGRNTLFDDFTNNQLFERRKKSLRNREKKWVKVVCIEKKLVYDTKYKNKKVVDSSHIRLLSHFMIF